jgi:SAM-dependent methyltransferase
MMMPIPLESSCLICGSKAGRVVCRKGGYDGHLCPCGGLYLSPPPPPDAVDPTIDPHPDFFYALPAAMKVHWLARSHPGGRLLEVGCGAGHFIAAALRDGYQVSAIEPHPARARLVYERLGVEVECALLEDSRLPPQSYDVIYHCDLLSHFPDPDFALRRMARLLRPNGVLFFEVGRHGNIASFWYRWLSEDSFPRHRWLYSEKGLRLLLDRCGLRVVRWKRFGLAPHVLAYRGASAVLRCTRALRGNRADAGSSGAVRRREWPLESRWHNFMRFRVGAVAPPWGPQTLFVLASLKEQSNQAPQ